MGLTLPEIDSVLSIYAEKSYKKYYDEYREINPSGTDSDADEYAVKKVRRDYEQGFQSWEYRFNTVGSSRGDYPFISISFGMDTSRFGLMASEICLKVREGGQGKDGFKRPVLFPKLTFLYHEDLHGEGKPYEWLFDIAVKCSSKTMYPDYLSLSGKGYIADIYKKYGKIISLMGCVDGMSTIKYKFVYTDKTEEVFEEPIRMLWNRLKVDYGLRAEEQVRGISSHLYIDTGFIAHKKLKEVQIYDTKKKFVRVRKVVRNIAKEWRKITFDKPTSLMCTPDHPLPIMNNKKCFVRTYAKDLQIGDKLLYQDKTVMKVTNIETVFLFDYSYDVETASDHFEVNGVYSHNCRASLSPWFKEGGMTPIDDEEKPTFIGRCNLGVVSLHLPMILAKAREENKDFYDVLDYYLEMIRGLHRRTFEFLAKKKAGTNPLVWCQGGFIGGTKNPDEPIGEELLRPMTMSFGITALNELQQLYNGKSLVEDGDFALEVVKYINEYINRIKKTDNILYAVYGVPAESLCGLQIEQFRNKYGIIKGVSDRAYVSNSFHCGVWEDITPIQKQDLEERFWDYFNGGKIQYCRYSVPYNYEAQKTLIRRAMAKGFYEGCNLALSYCEDCGYEQLEMNKCPKCGSDNICQIDRMNGLTT